MKFSLSLDVFDLCSKELQQKILPMRLRMKEEDDKLIEVPVVNVSVRYMLSR